jgi:hemoglobin/transferrin/lactoferrin receptor protein
MKLRNLFIPFWAILVFVSISFAQEIAPPPAADTTKPVADTTKPAPETIPPAADTVNPAIEKTQPVADTTQPAIDTTKPAADTAKPAIDTLPQKAKPKESLISLDQPGTGVSKYFLNELVITTSRYQKSSFKVPNTVSVLNQDRIERSDPDIITDLFRNLPGVELNDAGPFAPRPVIRGLFGSRVLLLADGERLNDTRESPFSGAQLSLVDVNEIERVEVVNGPGTVLYGTDALGGVVNLITSKAMFKEEGAQPYGAKLKLRYSTVDKQYKGDLKVNYAKDKWAFSAGAGTRAATDYEAPDTTVVNSAVHANNFDIKAGYKLNEKHKIFADYQRVEATNVGFPGVPNANFNGRFFYPERNRGKFALSYEGKNLNPHMPLLKGKVYYQTVKKDFRTVIDLNAPIYSYFIPNPPDTTFVTGVLNSINTKTLSEIKTLGASFQELFLIQPYQILTWGVDYYREMVQGSHNTSTTIVETHTHTSPPSESVFASVSEDNTPTVPEVNWDVAGLYAQDEINPWRFMTFLAGVRYEYSRSSPQKTKGIPDSSLPPEDTDRFLTWSLGAIYRYRPNLSLNFNLSQAYRNPNIVEKYFFGPASGGTWVITNTDLAKEDGISLDLGVKANLEQMSASFNFFFAEYKNFIDLRPFSYQGDTLYNGSRVWQWQNLPGITRIDGVEAAWEGDFSEEFYGFANATYTFGHQRVGRDDTTGASIPNTPTGIQPFFVPPFKIYFGLGWRQKGTGKLWAEVSARVVERQDRVPEGFPVTSGFSVYDLRGGYKFNKNVSFNLVIRNLTDETYVEPYNQINVSNQVLEPGRNFIFGVTINTD